MAARQRAAGRRKMRTGARAILFTAFFCFSAPAQAGDGPVFNVIWENDYYGGTDQGYSNGLELSYISREERGRGLARLLLRAKEDDTVRFGVAAGQETFTPHDTDASAPLPDDRPYAGWLYLEASSIVERAGGPADIFSVAAGVVGPSALAEDFQRSVHRLIRDDDVLGWDNQLRNEPGLMASFDRIWRPIRHNGGLGVDILPHLGVSAGNVLTEARGGATLRVGSGLERTLGPARMARSSPTGGYFSSEGLTWQIFAGGQARGVAHNIFLDGNTWRDSLSVEKKHFVGDLFFGAALQAWGFQFAYTHTFRTKEFEGQAINLDYGALTLSGAF
jgi:hypothetical protein